MSQNWRNLPLRLAMDQNQIPIDGIEGCLLKCIALSIFFNDGTLVSPLQKFRCSSHGIWLSFIFYLRQLL